MEETGKDGNVARILMIGTCINLCFWNHLGEIILDKRKVEKLKWILQLCNVRLWWVQRFQYNV
jgi:hypothetical protein